MTGTTAKKTAGRKKSPVAKKPATKKSEAKQTAAKKRSGRKYGAEVSSQVGEELHQMKPASCVRKAPPKPRD